MTKSILKLALMAVSLYAMILINVASAQPVACNGTGSATSPIALSNPSSCYTQPDEVKMTIYKIYLCTSAPGAPTTTVPINLSTCAQIFNNPNGAVGVINASTKTDASLLSGNTINKIALQNQTQYSHSYIEFSPSQIIKSSKTFNSSHTGADSSTGAYCWTGSGEIYAWTSAIPTNVSTCGASYTAGGYVTTRLNSLGGTGPFSATASFTNAGPLQDVSLNAYLMDSNYRLPVSGTMDSMGSVQTLGAVYPLSTAITHNPSTQDGLITSLNFSWGVEIFRASKTFFVGGPITVKFSPHCKSQSPC